MNRCEIAPPLGGPAGGVTIPETSRFPSRGDLFILGRGNLFRSATFSAERTIFAPSRLSAAWGCPSRKKGTIILSSKAARLEGLLEPDDVVDCGNSGTTMRLLTACWRPSLFFRADRRPISAQATHETGGQAP
jgi:3-phosphoshikimate 1-carboxyvinyltransferase